MEIMMSFAEAILFIVVPQAEAWGFKDLIKVIIHEALKDSK